MCLMMWSSKANCCFIFASFAPFHECLTLQLLDVRGIPKRHRQLLCILNSKDPLLPQSSAEPKPYYFRCSNGNEISTQNMTSFNVPERDMLLHL